MSDATLNNVDVLQTLPLTQSYVIHGGFAYALVGVAGSNYETIAEFTMPFYGDIVVQGTIYMATIGNGIQQIDVKVDPVRSIPAPATTVTALWRTEGGPSAPEVHRCMPILASWVNVPMGTNVTIVVFGQNGYGAPAMQFLAVEAFVYATKT